MVKKSDAVVISHSCGHRRVFDPGYRVAPEQVKQLRRQACPRCQKEQAELRRGLRRGESLMDIIKRLREEVEKW